MEKRNFKKVGPSNSANRSGTKQPRQGFRNFDGPEEGADNEASDLGNVDANPEKGSTTTSAGSGFKPLKRPSFSIDADGFVVDMPDTDDAPDTDERPKRSSAAAAGNSDRPKHGQDRYGSGRNDNMRGDNQRGDYQRRPEGRSDTRPDSRGAVSRDDNRSNAGTDLRSDRRFDKPAFAKDTEEVSHTNADMIFGIRAVEEVLKAGREIEAVYLVKETGIALQQVAKQVRDAGVPVKYVPQERLSRFTRGNHQGIVAFISPITYIGLDAVITNTFDAGQTPLFIMLDRVTDVRNIGAIARTADCSGAHAIIVPAKGSAQLNADAMKTSAGALNYLPVVREHNLLKSVDFMKTCGITIVACTEKATEDFHQFDFNQPIALLMGSEEDGISEDLMRKVDAHIKIPMVGHIESLNVSVATGIILYEALRQRQLAAKK